MSKMSDMHIEMTEDVLHKLTYEQFVEKYGQTYNYMYKEIQDDYIIENYQLQATL